MLRTCFRIRTDGAGPNEGPPGNGESGAAECDAIPRPLTAVCRYPNPDNGANITSPFYEEGETTRDEGSVARS